MATRPVFVPMPEHSPYVREVPVEFEWHAGFAISQAQKSIASMHKAAHAHGIAPLLEISSKSPERLGVNLSALNLILTCELAEMPVECAFQGSKVFQKGGPYRDLYTAPPRDAKRDPRIVGSGPLVGFRFWNEEFPLQPTTVFYDWLYLTALTQNPALSQKLMGYGGFTDIAFNPERSWNCQARSAALYVALVQQGIEVADLIASADRYLEFMSRKVVAEKPQPDAPMEQHSLFDVPLTPASRRSNPSKKP